MLVRTTYSAAAACGERGMDLIQRPPRRRMPLTAVLVIGLALSLGLSGCGLLRSSHADKLRESTMEDAVIAAGSPGVEFAGVSVSTIEDVNLRLSLRIDTELFDALTLCHTIVTAERTAPFGADRLTIDLVDTESAEQLNAHDYLAELRLNIDDSAGWSALWWDDVEKISAICG
ncbi:hypothetical protein [Agromyces atrinae]|uniref:Uncharacterized protein n=2 Tax=Agromyces atrinae TaxID=592376 RepID=A0A4Q2M3F6_9MICO|nr:hypothetical protein [Agromyces atrinae]RXZ86328.1 hypothetical protein ESP50_11260 [Agromyces atrinae]